MRVVVDLPTRDELTDEVSGALHERMLEERTARIALLKMNQLVGHDPGKRCRVAIHLRADQEAMVSRRAAGVEASDDEVHVGKDRRRIELLESSKSVSNVRLGPRHVEIRRADGIVRGTPRANVGRQILGAQDASTDEIAHADTRLVEVFAL